MKMFRIFLYMKTEAIKIFPVKAISPGEALDKVIKNNNINFDYIYKIKVIIGSVIK